MDHKQVDKLLKEVMEYHMGDFVINGDAAYSSRIFDRIQEKNSRRYSGVDTCFDSRNMYGTNGCEKSNGTFTVYPGGIVYGPYYSFEKGTYKAGYFIRGNADQCVLSVESSENMLTSCTAEQTKHGNGIYILEFELGEKIENLEIKLTNNGTETVVFEKIILKIGSEEIVPEVISNEAPVPAMQRPDLVDKLEELDLAQSQLTDRVAEIESTSDCALPLDTKYRLIKRIVRKVIKCYWRYQTVFNSLVARQYRAITDQMQRVVNSCHQIGQKLSAQSELLANMESRMQKSEQSLTEMEAALAEQASRMLAYQNRNASVQVRLHDELSNLEKKLFQIACNARTENKCIEHLQAEIKNLEERLILAENSGLVNDAAQKAETGFEKITECAGALQKSSESISKNTHEIGCLLDKIKEFDTNFSE